MDEQARLEKEAADKLAEENRIAQEEAEKVRAEEEKERILQE